MRKHREIYLYSIRMSVQCIRTSVQCIQAKTTWLPTLCLQLQASEIFICMRSAHSLWERMFTKDALWETAGRWLLTYFPFTNNENNGYLTKDGLLGVLTTQKVGLTVVDINEPKYSGINCSLQGRKRKNSESLNTGSYHPHHRKSALMTGPSLHI